MSAPGVSPMLRMTLDELRVVAGCAEMRADVLEERLRHQSPEEAMRIHDRLSALRSTAAAIRSVVTRTEREWRHLLSPPAPIRSGIPAPIASSDTDPLVG